MTDLSEPREVAERNTKLKLQERERHDALSGMMDVPQTRAWVHDLLVRCHVFETSFSNNVNVMSFREGERNVGLRTLNDVLRCAADRYLLMMKEANERDDSRDRGSG